MNPLYFEVQGNGPDLVLLHGWALNLKVWQGLAQDLRERYRIIAIDLPGHGRSEWTGVGLSPAEQAWWIHETLSSVSDRYALLGWSLGGQIALDLAAAFPGRIGRLILVATTPKFAASPDWPEGMPAATLASMTERLRTDYQGTVRDFLELQVRGGSASEQAVQQLREAILTHGAARPEALACGLQTLANSDLRPTLAQVHAPALVIAGQYDRITSPGASMQLAQAMPEARYVQMRRAAHAPFLSHRQEFVALLDEFLS